MKKTFLGLGSNVGDRENNIVHALHHLSKKLSIIDYSSLYDSAPIGYLNQDNFLNMVVEADTELVTPYELLSLVKTIEQKMGRKQTFHWGPRIIDIDILYIEGLHIDTDELTVPHRELWNRNFVLIPLSELTEFLLIDNKKLLIKEMIHADQTDQVSLHKQKEEISYNVQS
ncbi:MAG: 2-amino-4-hydroxy-6-hydroxymethyldihydropteridine diphosphokinase [Spirochaetota bacterium]|nr:MAG: 2-amino-4-hydroxy-6-hydroxymethyldihydropteridine diphosphokinase [Spirochaetota bacterium]